MESCILLNYIDFIVLIDLYLLLNYIMLSDRFISWKIIFSNCIPECMIAKLNASRDNQMFQFQMDFVFSPISVSLLSMNYHLSEQFFGVFIVFHLHFYFFILWNKMNFGILYLILLSHLFVKNCSPKIQLLILIIIP